MDQGASRRLQRSPWQSLVPNVNFVFYKISNTEMRPTTPRGLVAGNCFKGCAHAAMKRTSRTNGTIGHCQLPQARQSAQIWPACDLLVGVHFEVLQAT